MHYFLRTLTISLIFSALLLPSAVFAHTDGKIEVKKAWIRSAPPNAKVLAAYMTIENHTDNASALINIKSSAFERIEVHNTIEEDGMAKMIKQDSVEIPTEGEIVLKPGGMHIMLINPKQEIKTGKRVSLTLEFSNGSKSIISVKVKKGNGDPGHHNHHGSSNHDGHMKSDSTGKHDGHMQSDSAGKHDGNMMKNHNDNHHSH